MQPSLPEVWGHLLTPDMLHFAPANRARSASRQGRAHGHAPLRNRDQRDGRARGPAGESREGVALFGGGLGEPPTPPAPLPTREAGGLPERRRAHPDADSERPYESGNPGRGEEAKFPIRRESPERAQPSLVGAWGNPQPLSAPLPPQGSGRTSGGGDGRTPTPSRSAPTIWKRREDLTTKRRRQSRP